MPVWQLAAGFLAAVFVLVGAIAFVRYPRPIMAVVLGLVLAIPTIALALYAVAGGPPPEPGAVLWLAFIPAAAGLGTGAWMLAWMSTRRSSLTPANIELLSNGMLVAFGGLVLALSDVVALWEPWFAVANLALNAGWLLPGSRAGGGGREAGPRSRSLPRYQPSLRSWSGRRTGPATRRTSSRRSRSRPGSSWWAAAWWRVSGTRRPCMGRGCCRT